LQLLRPKLVQSLATSPNISFKADGFAAA
jgi:hypothetical protein